MSWKDICRVSQTALVKHKWHSTPLHQSWALAARGRVFGGASVSEDTKVTGVDGRNRKLLRRRYQEGTIARLHWPYVPPEFMTGKTHRDHEKLLALMAAGE